VRVLTPFVDLSAGREAERLATEEERKAGLTAPEVLNQSPADLQRRFRKDFLGQARAATKTLIRRNEQKRASH